jgi:8-oxo-dGTP diphosphatase
MLFGMAVPAVKVKSAGPTQCVAGKAIIVADGKVLVLRQSPEAAVDGANRYHPPGGIVEPGESLQPALLREVTEEVGLKVRIADLLAVEDGRVNIRGEDCQFFWVYYLCHLIGDKQVVLQIEEASAFAWVGMDDLTKIDILEPSRSVIMNALKLKTSAAS